MPTGFSITIPVQTTANFRQGGPVKVDHGELLLGKVRQVDPDGAARINFTGFEVSVGGSKLFQAGQRIFAHAQKTQDETMLSLLPNAAEGEVLTGSTVRRAGANLLTRFGDSEMVVRAAPGSPVPAPGEQVRAQIQIRAGKPVLQMLPPNAEGGEIGATVTAVRSDGSLILDAEGTPMIAESAVSHETGEQVRARLLFIRDKLILQILPKAPAPEAVSSERVGGVAAGFINNARVMELLDALASGELKIGNSQQLLALVLPLASEGTEQHTWLSGLLQALDAIMLSPQRAELAQQLATAMENSGLFLESRLLQAAISGTIDPEISGDLKLALLLAEQRLSGGPEQSAAARANLPANLAEVAGKAGQVLDTITAEQFQNVRMGTTNEIYVQLPFASDSGLESVEIHISPQGKKNAKKIDAANVLLTLAVTTSNLGRIKAALSIVEKKVSCRLKAERKSVVEFLNSNVGILKDGLEKLDYAVAYIDCSLGKSEGDLTIIRELSASRSEGLDVRA
jgi:hypothetical protein